MNREDALLGICGVVNNYSKLCNSMGVKESLLGQKLRTNGWVVRPNPEVQIVAFTF